MAFRGYFVRMIKGNTDWIFPMKYIKTGTTEFSPYKVMDLDPWYDSTGLLHRNVVSHTSATIKFSTPPMPIDEKETLFAKIRSMYTDTKARDCRVEYYNDETGGYDIADCYMVEPKFKPLERNGITGKILYDSVDIEFIKY